MKVKILVPQEIDIEATQLSGLAKKVRIRFEMDKNEPVPMIDIINQAVIEGFLTAPPDGFEVAAEWIEPLTNADLTDLESEGDA